MLISMLVFKQSRKMFYAFYKFVVLMFLRDSFPYVLFKRSKIFYVVVKVKFSLIFITFGKFFIKNSSINKTKRRHVYIK